MIFSSEQILVDRLIYNSFYPLSDFVMHLVTLGGKKLNHKGTQRFAPRCSKDM
jgi:hypothetical protein